MQHVAPLPAPRESIYAVLASSARTLSEFELGSIAVASGIVALVAAALGRASWVLLGGCYVVWSFAGWGIVFGPRVQRPKQWRALELIIVSSGTGVFAILVVGLFFWALGSHWQL